MGKMLSNAFKTRFRTPFFIFAQTLTQGIIFTTRKLQRPSHRLRLQTLQRVFPMTPALFMPYF